MEIRLLGPELDNAQKRAHDELVETIRKKQEEVEKEVLASLSEFASDGRRVLKSQRETYEMMLELDKLVKENEDLFLKVNALCSKTGVSLSAIIERMVTKNRELREKQEISQEKENIEPVVIKEEKPHIDYSYNPNEIKYAWQKETFGNNDVPIVPLPNVENKEVRIEEVKLPEPEVVKISPLPSSDYSLVANRRLSSWENINERNNALIKARMRMDCYNKSEDYRVLSKQIEDLILNHTNLPLDEINRLLDGLDQSIGANSKSNVPEKKKLYKKLNFCAKNMEKYAHSSEGPRLVA